MDIVQILAKHGIKTTISLRLLAALDAEGLRVIRHDELGSRKGPITKKWLLSHVKQVPSKLGTPCWEWMLSRTKIGYGSTSVGRTSRLIHRVSYELFVGPIPAGLMICHKCNNRPCCNPDHLIPGTDRDNFMDQVAAGTNVWGAPRLADDEVRKIKYLLLRGDMMQKDIARQFNFTKEGISFIKTGKTYRHVTLNLGLLDTAPPPAKARNRPSLVSPPLVPECATELTEQIFNLPCDARFLPTSDCATLALVNDHASTDDQQGHDEHATANSHISGMRGRGRHLDNDPATVDPGRRRPSHHGDLTKTARGQRRRLGKLVERPAPIRTGGSMSASPFTLCFETSADAIECLMRRPGTAIVEFRRRSGGRAYFVTNSDETGAAALMALSWTDPGDEADDLVGPGVVIVRSFRLKK